MDSPARYNSAMLNTYRAILEGNVIRWLDASPNLQHPVQVHVTLLGETSASAIKIRAQAMKAALQNLAQSKALEAITDPLAWQKAQRQDRNLPGRE